MKRDRVSHICEWLSGIGKSLGACLAGGCLALAGASSSAAAPDIDYQNGSRAARNGDLVAAAASLRRAADAGHAPSQALLASILDEAEYNEEALTWYRKAAEQGNADGEFGLGTMYMSGEAVKRDPAQAYAWFLRAAERKHDAATLALANAYLRFEKGELDVGPERARAAEWLAKAAALDYLPALDALALAYRAGNFGLAPDLALAQQHAARADAIRRKSLPEKGRKKK